MLKREPKTQAEHLEALALIILSSALDRRPLQIPPGFKQILEAAMDHVMPHLREWFAHEVLAIISGKKNDNLQPRWGTMEAHLIVSAALRQLSINCLEYRLLWKQALGNREFASTALQAFTTDPSDLATSLEDWWEVNPQNRNQDLRNFVEQLVYLVSDPNKLKSLIQHKGGGWSPDLRMAVNQKLEELKLEPVFPPITSTVQ
ncbi:MAG: hypothetical protein KW793_02635 [Candidatus Doudnabacteria bacterium]|nr:hypothetical protein [Candidatus Doudnabacteria bacterium]